MDFVGYNPLQNSIDVHLKAAFVTSEQLEKISEEAQMMRKIQKGGRISNYDERSPRGRRSGGHLHLRNRQYESRKMYESGAGARISAIVHG